MNVDAARVLKSKLEGLIKSQIEEFEGATGLKVSGVSWISYSQPVYGTDGSVHSRIEARLIDIEVKI